jgi:hypothetical protein
MPTNPPQEREKNKLATTNVTNEHARAIASLIEARTGQVDDDFTPVPDRVFPIRLTGTETGAGKYVAVRVNDSDGDVTTDGDADHLDIGDDATAAPWNNILAVNLFELGQTGGTHDLTPGANEIFQGFLFHTNEDGRKCVMFWGVDPLSCSDS